MKISKEGLDFIKKHEGFRSNPYLDIGGVPTIGYGTTRHGALPVMMHDEPISEKEASDILEQDVNATYGAVVNRYVTVEIGQNQYDALVSFAYNLGSHSFTESTLLKYVNLEHWDAAKKEFVKWNHVHGRVVAGLTTRRKAEAEMFLS